MKIYGSAAANIQPDELVTITQAGNHIKEVYIKNRATTQKGTKIDKDHYSDKNGVMRECRHTENRQQNIKSVRKSFNELCDIINANTSDISRCKLITLTYRENMTDLKQLNKDWGNFLKKARRKWGNFEYIKVKEPQGRGAWHLHVILIFDRNAPYMDNTILNKIWGKGMVEVENVNNEDKFSSYFTPYSYNMSLEEAESADITIDPKKITKDKKHIKGARLEMYPRGTRIFDCSNGVQRPTKVTMTKAQANTLLANKKKVSEYSTVLTDDDGEYINEIFITNYVNK